MGRLLMVFGLGAGVFLLYRIQHAPPPPSAPPPPPRIELPPAPVVSEVELAKIRAAAKDADPHVRWAAIELLYRVHDPMATQVLRELLTTDSDPTVKTKAIEVLEKSGDPKYAQDIILALKDTDKDVRIAALIALAQIADARMAPAVIEMLRDYEPSVRMEALHTMGRFQEKRQQEYQQLALRLKEEYEKSLEAQKHAQRAQQTGLRLPDIEDVTPRR
ncbi:MAG: HEAT repeat domain-containing protein [Elusimicrobia bacterium]|nr:HEAT repeat domain-containing protein [Elusimicrobiota bacterium]